VVPPAGLALVVLALVTGKLDHPAAPGIPGHAPDPMAKRLLKLLSFRISQAACPVPIHGELRGVDPVERLPPHDDLGGVGLTQALTR
jgi:hypothetical protein